MKTNKRLVSFALSAILAMSAIPSISCSAAAYRSTDSNVSASSNITVEFAVVTWTEKDNELTITGCYPMTSTRLADYGTLNAVGVCIFNGELQLPTEINGMPVTKISSVNMLYGINAKVVKVNESIEVSPKVFRYANALVYQTDDELKLQQILF